MSEQKTWAELMAAPSEEELNARLDAEARETKLFLAKAYANLPDCDFVRMRRTELLNELVPTTNRRN